MRCGRSGMAQNCVKPVMGDGDSDIDPEIDCEKTEESSSSSSDDEFKTHPKTARMCPDDPESDGASNSSSTDDSSDSSDSPNNTSAVLPNANMMCASCGRGPYKSMKLHLLHCSGVRVKYQCSRCKELFPTNASMNEHYLPLYSCDVCGQVFPQEKSYHQHQCPKTSKAPLVLFCCNSMPSVCNICKSFFTSEKTLLHHVTRIHMSVVSRKVCIVTNPSAVNEKKVLPEGTVAQLAPTSPKMVSQVINGKLGVSKTCTQLVSDAGKSVSISSSEPGKPTPAAAANNLEKEGALGQTANRPTSSHLPLSAPAPASGDTDTTPASADSDSPPMPTIMAMFANDSEDLARIKRMNTAWRAKAPYSCRQCGAVFRQPSLIISHRYLHRGRRSHLCQCGRAFKHRLHLLRHCVQHAESLSYICVSCGETFTGARLLAEHIKGKPRKKSCSGRKWKHKVKQECRVPFTCDCGQLFLRPSAYIWHQLQNRTETKRLKKPVK